MPSSDAGRVRGPRLKPGGEGGGGRRRGGGEGSQRRRVRRARAVGRSWRVWVCPRGRLHGGAWAAQRRGRSWRSEPSEGGWAGRGHAPLCGAPSTGTCAANLALVSGLSASSYWNIAPLLQPIPKIADVLTHISASTRARIASVSLIESRHVVHQHWFSCCAAAVALHESYR